jgi:hypothetical protein
VAETIKVLAQLDGPTSLTALYTVPAATSTVVSSLVIANRAAVTRTFSVKVAVGGAADDPKQFIYATVNLTKNNTFVATIGMTLAATDVIRVICDATGALNFTLFGTEYT